MTTKETDITNNSPTKEHFFDSGYKAYLSEDLQT